MTDKMLDELKSKVNQSETISEAIGLLQNYRDRIESGISTHAIAGENAENITEGKRLDFLDDFMHFRPEFYHTGAGGVNVRPIRLSPYLHKHLKMIVTYSNGERETFYAASLKRGQHFEIKSDKAPFVSEISFAYNPEEQEVE